jgi:hypothetical protein
MLKRTQWTQVPSGASGSSKLRAKLAVVCGGSLQESGGEMSSPSHVYSSGIASPGAKAALVSSSVAPVVGEGGEVVAPQPLTSKTAMETAAGNKKRR